MSKHRLRSAWAHRNRSGGREIVYDPNLIVFDTFTGADDTDLNGRAPDAINTPGQTWVAAASNAKITDNRFAPGGTTARTATYALGQSDARIICAYKTGDHATDDFLQLQFRYQNATNFWYLLLGKAGGSGVWKLCKYVSGSNTDVQTGSFSYAANIWHVVEVEYNAGDIVARYDGGNELTASGQTDLADQTGVGVTFLANGTPRVDDYQVYTP